MKLTAEETNRFDALYRQHSAAIFRVCLNMGAGDRQFAFDRAQDTFMRLAKHLHELDDVDNVGGWLYRVAVNECRMYLRRNQIWWRVRSALRVAPTRKTISNPGRDAQSRRDTRRFESAIAEMPPRLRTIMVLVYLEGRSQTAVCEVLKLSKAQVSKLHKKALDILRALDWELDL